MSRNSTLILLGILTVLTPFSGLPVSFRTLLAVIFGALVAGIAFSLRADAVAQAVAPAPSSPTPTEPTVTEESATESAPQGISPI